MRGAIYHFKKACMAYISEVDNYSNYMRTLMGMGSYQLSSFDGDGDADVTSPPKPNTKPPKLQPTKKRKEGQLESLVNDGHFLIFI